MMKRILLALSLVLCAALLCACGSSGKDTTRYDVMTDANAAAAATQNVFANGQAASVTAPPVLVVAEPAAVSVATATPVLKMSSEYAGATPVVIDPIDKPTPSPLPALSFEYETYDASTIHISFSAPKGWMVDESADSITITSTDTRADAQTWMSVTVIPVSKDYSDSELKTEVITRMKAIKGDYYTFTYTDTAKRTLLDKNGRYADYTATLSDGTKIKGRIQVASVNKKLYVVQMQCPDGYFETYKKSLYNKFRDTIKITQ